MAENAELPVVGDPIDAGDPTDSAIEPALLVPALVASSTSGVTP